MTPSPPSGPLLGMASEKVALPRIPARPFLFLLGLANAMAGITFAWVVARRAPGAIGPFSVAICALGLVSISKSLYELHREQSWHGRGAEGASGELALNLAAVQIGIIVGFEVFAVALDRGRVIDLFGFQMNGIFAHRVLPGLSAAENFATVFKYGLSVSCVTLLLGGIYKEGGVALALTWNGSLLGVALAQIVRTPNIRPMQVLLTLLSLLAATLAYHVAGMVGLFLARGAQKYKFGSTEFSGISRTCLLLYGSLMALLGVSSALSGFAANFR